jgi:hypothetical protein
MAGLRDLLVIYYAAKRYTKRAYGSASNRYNEGLEEMRPTWERVVQLSSRSSRFQHSH